MNSSNKQPNQFQLFIILLLLSFFLYFHFGPNKTTTQHTPKDFNDLEKIPEKTPMVYLIILFIECSKKTVC